METLTNISNSESILTSKGLKAVIIKDALRDYLRTNKKTYNVGNLKYFECFISDLIDYLVKNNKMGKFPTRKETKAVLASYNLSTTAEWISFIMENKDSLEKAGIKLTSFHIKDKKMPKSKFYTAENWRGGDEERTVVVRSKYGNYPTLISDIPLVGPMSGANRLLTEIKLDYMYTTGCPFYDIREILFVTWNALDENDPRRYSTCQASVIGKED